ncbi:MAG: BatD family protein [Eubacteriales bacterium]
MRRLIFLLVALFTINSIYADSKVTFTASAPEAVAVGDQFRLSYTVTTQNVRDFRAPSIKGFDVLMGPSRSQQSSTQIINGNVSSASSITFTYILMATTEGHYSIAGATIVADGNQILSNSLKIKVLPADKSASGANTSSRQGSSVGQSSSSSVSTKDLFITATASKTNLYEQEAFLLTFKIYTVVDLRSFSNVKLPDFKGFHSQEVELPSNPKWELENFNGRNYHTTVYRQFVLFPQQSGKLVIESARFDASIAKAVQSADPFDAFFNGGSNYVELKKSIITPKITINVNPLPAGKPVGFSGGVGNFNITSSINSKDVKTNDAITIKLVISGIGNLKLIDTPKIKFPENIELYDPKVDNKVRLTKEGLSGSKVIEYLAIPRDPGTFKIPAVEFSYFDIKTKSYKTLKTEEYDINVTKGAGNADQVIANFTNKEDLKVLGEDIRYIKLGEVNLQPRDSYMFDSIIYWLFYIIPIIVFVVMFIIGRKQIAENANIIKLRTKKANKVASKRMKRAGKLLEENKKEAFYDEVLKALWGYISDKLNIPASLLSKENVEEALKNYGVDEELIRAFLSTLDECEFARYAPGDESQAMDKVYTATMDVISRIENSIKH